MKLRDIVKDLNLNILDEENIDIKKIFCTLDDYSNSKNIIMDKKQEKTKFNPKESIYILKNVKVIIKNGEKKYLNKTTQEIFEEAKEILSEKIGVLIIDEEKVDKKVFEDTFGELINFNNTKVIFVKDISKYEGIIASNFLNTPSLELKVIGIYGDKNGKYVSEYINEIYKESNIKTFYINERKDEIKNALELQKTLDSLRKTGVKVAIINVSAQGLKNGIYMGTFFESSIFSDISEDKKYWEQNFDNINEYLNNVMKLFMISKYNIINNDDYASDYIKKLNKNFYTFGIVNKSTYNATDVNIRALNTNYLIIVNNKVERIEIRMHGMDLVYSSLAAITYSIVSGLNFFNITNALKKTYIPYKKEMIENELELQILLDETDDPEEIEEILKEAKKLVTGRVTVVVSRNGLDIYDDLPVKIEEIKKDGESIEELREKIKKEIREKTEKIKKENQKEIEKERNKRKRLGEVLSKHANIGIITTGSSKFENQNQIIKEIEEGINKNKIKTFKYLDRKEAIISAMYNIQKRDLVAIFGIGDESINIKGKKEYIDQKEIIKNYLNENENEIKLR